MDTTKIIGWLIFIIGISIIVLTIYHTYNIFTGKASAPEIISLNIEKPKTSGQGGLPTNPDQFREMISQQLANMLPLESLPQFLNLIVWTIGAGVLMLGGSKIAGLGVNLIKK
ncbi:MAG: hypothetical protein ACKKMP_03640 [Candidatus Nealsonbacteria bacterium]